MYFDYMLSLCFIFDLTNNILEMLTSISCKILLDNLHLISMHLAIYMRMTNCEREEVYNVYFVFFLNSIIKKIKLLKMYPTLMFSLKKRVQTLKYLKNTLKLSKRVQKYLYHQFWMIETLSLVLVLDDRNQVLFQNTIKILRSFVNIFKFLKNSNIFSLIQFLPQIYQHLKLK